MFIFFQTFIYIYNEPSYVEWYWYPIFTVLIIKNITHIICFVAIIMNRSNRKSPDKVALDPSPIL